MVVEEHSGLGVQAVNVPGHFLFEPIAAGIAHLQHALPVLVPARIAGHRPAALGLKLLLAGRAPAPVRGDEALVRHVQLDPVDPVGELFGDQLLYVFKITGPEADPLDGLAVGGHHPPLRMPSERFRAILKATVGHDRQAKLVPFLYRLAQDVAAPKSGRLGLVFRVVIDALAIPDPDRQKLTAGLFAAPRYFAPVELRRISRVVRVEAGLRSRGVNVHAHPRSLEPRHVLGRGAPGAQRPGQPRREEKNPEKALLEPRKWSGVGHICFNAKWSRAPRQAGIWVPNPRLTIF